MIVPLISEVKIDGRRITCEEVCNLFLKLSDEEAEDFLRYLLKYVSNELFLFYVQGLIYKVLFRYLVVDSIDSEDLKDLVSSCCCEVLCKLKDYDVCKGKLVSFIYTIVRGVVTKYLYRRMKELRSIEYVDVLFYRSGELRGDGVMYLYECENGEDVEDEVELKVRVWERVKKEMFGKMEMN